MILNTNKKATKRTVAMRIIDILVWILTVVGIVLMATVLVGGSVNPQVSTLPAFVILAAPFVILLNMITLLYWVIRWRIVGMVITIAFMCVWVWSVDAFVQMRFWAPRIERADSNIKILTYNVHNFSFYDGSGSSLESIMLLMEIEKPDIICFQEYQLKDKEQLNQITSRLADWPYSSNMFSESINPEVVDCVIYSKFPISQPIPITSEGSTGGALQVDLYPSKGDTIRLFTCHMQTTAFNRVNANKSVTELIHGDDTKVVIDKTAHTLADNFRIRSAQADTLSISFDQSPYPTIVTGDLNSVPLSYTYRRICGNRGDAFRDAGQGYGYTYRPMRGLLRIDYVFYDTDRFECLDYRSPIQPMSDHNPVIVTLKNRI